VKITTYQLVKIVTPTAHDFSISFEMIYACKQNFTIFPLIFSLILLRSAHVFDVWTICCVLPSTCCTWHYSSADTSLDNDLGKRRQDRRVAHEDGMRQDGKLTLILCTYCEHCNDSSSVLLIYKVLFDPLLLWMSPVFCRIFTFLDIWVLLLFDELLP
jgi:hypothetical protein